MKKTLVMTAAALAGLTAIAAAQTPQSPSGGGATKPEAGQIEQKAAPAGALKYQNEAQPGAKAASPGGAAQGTPADKPDQRMGQSQKSDMSPQRGAQAEHGTVQNSAQPESGKAGVSAATTTGPGKSRGAAVQLSQDQRSRIGATIGKSSSGRVTTRANFDVSVGAKIPGDVHITVLPADVVEIVPQYEGFDYVMVGDQILIIDPNTLEIVAVIAA
jgi:Protein of unknown function (DUF1236)